MAAQPQPASPPSLDLSHDYPVPVPNAASKPPKPADIISAIFFAMKTLHSAATSENAKVEAVRYAHSLVADRAPEASPEIAQRLDDHNKRIDALREMIVKELAEMKTDLQTTKKDVRTMKDDMRTMKEDLRVLREDVNKVTSKMSNISESRFTDLLRIERAQLSNMAQPRPENLEQVPGPDGTLPWDTLVQGPDGEEIILTPLVSLDAVQALGASQLDAYLQVYYPGLAVPEDLTERKRKVLLAIGRSRESYEIV